VRFLIDAQLPRRLAASLNARGHDAIHTLDLPLGNRTPDREIIALADRQARVVVTKDDDFVQSFLVNDAPRRLLLLSTGNISNAHLERLFWTNLDTIVHGFDTCRFVELSQHALLIHE